MSMLAIKGVAVDHGRMRAVWDVSLDVAKGQSIALIGMDGAGKSTTLGAISGLYAVSQGDILLDGESIRRCRARDILSRGVVLVPEGRRLWPNMTVRENLEMGVYLPEFRGRLSINLETVFALFPMLEEKSSSPAGELSGGQQAAVAVARALMSSPKVLLLDEPFIGMSPLFVEQLKDSLRTARQRTGVTIILVDQDFVRAMSITQRSYVLVNGRTVMEGSGAELLANPEFAKTFLGIDKGEDGSPDPSVC